jgi:hypothetical protein
MVKSDSRRNKQRPSVRRLKCCVVFAGGFDLMVEQRQQSAGYFRGKFERLVQVKAGLPRNWSREQKN